MLLIIGHHRHPQILLFMRLHLIVLLSIRLIVVFVMLVSPSAALVLYERGRSEND